MSDQHVQRDLLHEFALHEDVTATAITSDERPTVAIELRDSPQALWDVRATVGMFDDRAEEVEPQ